MKKMSDLIIKTLEYLKSKMILESDKNECQKIIDLLKIEIKK